jgi:serine protease Do
MGMRSFTRASAILLLQLAAGLAQQPAARPPAGSAPPADAFTTLSDSIEGLSHRVSHSVVQVFSTGYALADEEQSGGTRTAGLVTKQRSSGSGVILSPDGYIVTNNHVVQNARRVRVQLVSAPDTPDTAPDNSDRAVLRQRGKLLEARVVGADRAADLAVLKVESDKPLPALRLADSEMLRQGQMVLAFGNPLGLENSVSLGVVSSVGRQIRPDDPMIYIQTDAPINPGNSGGPLLNAKGDVVGINTFILSQSGGSEGIGFAIPSNIVSNGYEQIRKDGHVHRGEIGATPQSITPDMAAALNLKQDWGVILGDVQPDGPAAQAGLEPGDIVLSLNGKAMDNAFRFLDLVKPETNQVPKLGIIGIALTKELGEALPETRKPYGIVVAARSGDGEYTGQGGLKLGDVIYSVNNVPTATLDALRKAVDGLGPADPLVMQIERDGKLLYLTLSE